MSISDTKKIDSAFKFINGKSFSTIEKGLDNEDAPSGFLIGTSSIFSQDAAIPTTAPGASTSVLTFYDSGATGRFRMIYDISSPTNLAWYASSDGSTLTTMRNTRQDNWISPTFGNYTIRIFLTKTTSTTASYLQEIFFSDATSPIFDYKAGILTFTSDPLAAYAAILGGPPDGIQISGYRYVGLLLSDLFDGYGTFVNTAISDSAPGIFATGGPTDGYGVIGQGVGTGAGVAGFGDPANVGVGVYGYGGPISAGVHGVGGSTGAPGVIGKGGGSNTASVGVLGIGTSTTPGIVAEPSGADGSIGFGAVVPNGVRYIFQTDILGFSGGWYNEIRERWYSGADATHLSGMNWIIVGGGTGVASITSESYSNQYVADLAVDSTTSDDVYVVSNNALGKYRTTTAAYLECDISIVGAATAGITIELGFMDDAANMNAFFSQDFQVANWFSNTQGTSADLGINTLSTSANTRMRIEYQGALIHKLGVAFVNYYIAGVLVKADHVFTMPPLGTFIRPFFRLTGTSAPGGVRHLHIAHVNAGSTV